MINDVTGTTFNAGDFEGLGSVTAAKATAALLPPITHNGTAGQDTFPEGTDGRTDIFTVDSAGSQINGADIIKKFEDGRDKVRFGDLGGVISENANKVSWIAVVNGEKTDIIIFAGDAYVRGETKVLARIEDFKGTFNADDFDGLTESIDTTSSGPVITDGKNEFPEGTDGVVDTFTVDVVRSETDEADVITGFNPEEDIITFTGIFTQGDSPAPIRCSFNQIVLRRVVNADGTVDTHVRVDSFSKNDNTGDTLAVIKNYKVDKTALPKFLINFITDREYSNDKWFTIRLDSAFEGVPGDADTPAANMVNITSGTPAGRQELYNTAAIDYYLLDAGVSERGDADALLKDQQTNGFDADNDKIVLADNDVTKVVVKVEGTSTILYKDSVGVGNVLAVINDFAATGENFTIDDFLIQPGQNNEMEVEVLVTDGSAAGKQTLVGSSGKQTFKVDGAGSNAVGADVIRNFSKTDGDVIEVVGYKSGWIFLQNNKDVTGDRKNDTIVAILDGAGATANSIVAVIDDFTGTLENDDFVNNFNRIVVTTDIV